MSTSLLLEGEDLEALLIRAHQEGGPQARIVRAEKVRHGGVMGFFARERFEVAVEIPTGAPRTAVRAATAGTTGDAAATAQPAAVAAPAPVAAAAAPDAATPATSGTPAADPAAPRSRREARAREQSSLRPATRDGEPAKETVDVPAPAQLAADGLLGIADRVSAAERAAARAIAQRTEREQRATAQADLRARALAELEALAQAQLEAQQRSEVATRARVEDGIQAAARMPALVGAAAGGAAGLPPTPATPLLKDGDTAMERPATATPAIVGGGTPPAPRPAAPGTAGPGAGALASPGAADGTGTGTTGTGTPGTGTEPYGYGLDTRARLAGYGVPHEPATELPQPSTVRPEFTALLDQLRAGARSTRDLTPADPAVDPGLDAGLDHRLDAGLDPGLDPALDAAPAPARDPLAELRLVTRQPLIPQPAAPQSGPLVQAPPPAAPGRPAPPQPAAAPGRTPIEEALRAEQAEARPADAPTTGGPLRPTRPAAGPAPAAELEPDAAQARVAVDRRTLRALGVPAAWTRRLRAGDRFSSVLRMLDRMPEVEIDPDATVIAVVGSPEAVGFEAHRVALDLPLDTGPRPVRRIPARAGAARATAIGRVQGSGPVVVAIEVTDLDDAQTVLETLTAVEADAVIAVVDAEQPWERTQRWIDSLGRVDALAVEGTLRVTDPAAVLQLGLPVLRLDGIPVDRVTWTAVLCARLDAALPASGGR